MSPGPCSRSASNVLGQRLDAITPSPYPSPALGRGDADSGSFQDPVLQDLIRTALEENKDLQVAVARVAEARAQLGVTRSAQFPQVDGQASYANQRFSQNSFPLNALQGILVDL